MNIVAHPRSGLCRVLGRPKELDNLENSLSMAVGQTGHHTGHGALRTWVRTHRQELSVLTGSLLMLDLRHAGQLMLPACRLTEPAKRLATLNKTGFLRPYQAEAVWAAVMAPFGRGVIIAPTGSGKTRICYGVAQVVGGLWAYLAPSQALAAQTAKEAPDNMVCCSFGCVKDSLLLACDGLIVDESHRIAAETWSRIPLRSNAKFRIGLSATALMRSDPKNSLTIGLLGPVVYKISLLKLQADGFLPGGTVQTVLF